MPLWRCFRLSPNALHKGTTVNQTALRLAFVALLPAMSSVVFAQTNAADLETRRAQLNHLLSEQWEYNLKTSPEFASMIGDKRYNDKLTDFSQAAINKDLKQTKVFLDEFSAVDTSGFPDQEALNKELMVRSLKIQLEGAQFKDWEMPVLQNSGIHIDAPQMVSVFPFDTVKDYEDYIARLKQLPTLFEQTIVQMRNGMHDGLMPPQFVLPKIVRQCDDIAATKLEDSPFVQPTQHFPASFSESDKKRLKAGIMAAVRDQIVPTYKKFSTFVRTEYVPKGRKDPGLWSLPDGQARYAFRVKASTTTNMTPEQIHQLGLSEVKRIEDQMLAVAQKQGYSDLKSFNEAIHANPALHPKSRQEILDLYTKYTDQMYTMLPQLFGRLPKGKVTVMPVEEFREKEASGAAYVQGTPDGSRPGHIEVNTGDFANRLTIGIETTALHEGVPGHHMQIAIGQELGDLPSFRQQGNYTAYAEGWALYSERLGEEVGFYKDPYSYYGHLQDEMLRAIRLVVDTGLHYKKWNRQQVVDFFHNHSGIEEVEVQSETDRYIVWPGQALGYKVGQLKILELRDYAKQDLGTRFDIRAFHDTVLGAGALPMDVLERRVKSWADAQKVAISQ